MDRAALVAAMQAAKPKPQPVTVPAWGMTVYVKAMTLAEAEETGRETGRALARGLASVIVDERGKRVFDPENDDDLDLIEGQGMAALGPLLDVVNGKGMTETALEKAGNVSTPAKN